MLLIAANIPAIYLARFTRGFRFIKLYLSSTSRGFSPLVVDLVVLMRRSPRKGILGPLGGIVLSILAIAVVQWAAGELKRVAEVWAA